MIEKWIIPCNTKHFDVVNHFQHSDMAVWKNSFTIKRGDVVYLYLSAPYGEIRYRCTVINDEVSDEVLAANSYAIVEKPSNNYFSKKIKYIQIKKEYEYPEGLLSLSVLKEHGLGQVQIQARTDKRLKAYIDQADEMIHRGRE